MSKEDLLFRHRQQVRVLREGYDDLKRHICERFAASKPTEIAGRRVVRVRDDDGFKFYLEDGSWTLVRFSGTEPLIRVYSEAPSQEKVKALIEALIQVLGVKP
ncbi:MAG TPA: hypothetical protein VGR61_11075 [Candidatus Dormibacteraeota bacterium]|nr:hypothetical protein [Candidatus Dormibacteraeota bacterium]